MDRMTFATHICVFNQDKWLKAHIENIYEHFDIIYLSYSNKPWTYNPQARIKYTNNINIDELKKIDTKNKIKFVKGDWNNETEQRNECVELSVKDNIDYLMIIDTDEFYTAEDIKKIKLFITLNPNYDFYKCGWVSFWKNFEYHVVGNDNNPIIGYPQISINIKKGVTFKDRRIPSSSNFITIPDSICYHGSFCLTDAECLSKLETWGHSHEFDYNRWYNEVWLNWDEKKGCLHPTNPCGWMKAVYDPFILPQEIKIIFEKYGIH